MAFTAFLDADVLFPVGLRDTLLSIAARDVYSPRWSVDVLEEMRRNVLKEYPGIAPNEMDEMIGQMRRAFPEAEVTGYRNLIAGMPCSKKDRHVLAAAVIAKAGVLVTNNVKDFPLSECAELGIEVQSADDFLAHDHQRCPGTPGVDGAQFRDRSPGGLGPCGYGDDDGTLTSRRAVSDDGERFTPPVLP